MDARAPPLTPPNFLGPSPVPSKAVPSPLTALPHDTILVLPSSNDLVRSLSSPGLVSQTFTFPSAVEMSQTLAPRQHIRNRSLSEADLDKLSEQNTEQLVSDDDDLFEIPLRPSAVLSALSDSRSTTPDFSSQSSSSENFADVFCNMMVGTQNEFYPQHSSADAPTEDLFSPWYLNRENFTYRDNIISSYSEGTPNGAPRMPVKSDSFLPEEMESVSDVGCARHSVAKESLEQLHELECEQESLNNSLLALTTHFAQVQFRLKQIIQSDDGEREALLKELEQFAFQGCPTYDVNETLCTDFERRLSQQKAKHEELIFQLKFQLRDLEKFARQTSLARTDDQIRRHKIVLENLRKYLKIDINDLYMLPSDELQGKVEQAIHSMLSPMRSKEQMLYQLTTQVQDLERFIEFLHGTGTTPNALAHEIRRCTCNCPLHGDVQDQQTFKEASNMNLKRESINLLSKTLFMLHVLVISSLRVLGLSWQPSDKPPAYMSHLRRLEESVDNLIRVYSSKDQCSQEMVMEMVRKQVAGPLKVLFAHGLRSGKKEGMLISCTSKKRPISKSVHPWQLFSEFYNLQHGQTFTQQPQYQLSQSFGLRIQRQSINSKQSLLSCIYQVKDSHEPYRRSNDAKFRALIIHGINDGMLGQWSRVLAQCDTLHQLRYEPWSFMTKHGFSEAIKILDRLSSLRFDLPADIALKVFHVPEGIESPIY